MAKAIRYKPGQNFVLDQKAASLIRKNRTLTYIIGRDLGNLKKALKKEKFKGTIIKG
jgi:uridylate kinase